MSRFLLAFLIGLLALPAAAQAPGAYAVFASQADLDDGGTLAGAIPTCLAPRTSSAPVVFFDETSGAVAVHDAAAAPGARTTILVSASVLDAAAGADVVTCRDVALGRNPEDLYVSLSDAADADRVLRLDLDAGMAVQLTDPTSADDAGDGIAGIVFVNTGLGDRVFLARNKFFGAPEDGIYSIDDEAPAQVPAVEALDPDLDLIDATGDGNYVLLVSSEFGENGKDNVVYFLDDLRLDPTLVLAADPCRPGSGGEPPAFDDCSDGGIEGLAIGEYGYGNTFPPSVIFPYVHLLNNAFSGPEGEVVGSFDANGDLIGYELVDVPFTESGLVGATPATGFTPSAPAGAIAAPTWVFSGGTPVLYLAGSADFGGTPGIYSVVPTDPTASEAPLAASGARLDVAPNPSTSGTTVRLSLGRETISATLAVYDALGRRVAMLHQGPVVDALAVELDTSGWAAGVYAVVVEVSSSRPAGAGAERIVEAFTVVR